MEPVLKLGPRPRRSSYWIILLFANFHRLAEYSLQCSLCIKCVKYIVEHRQDFLNKDLTSETHHILIFMINAFCFTQIRHGCTRKKFAQRKKPLSSWKGKEKMRR